MFVFVKCCFTEKTVAFPTKQVTVESLAAQFKIDLNEGLPVLMKLSGPSTNMIEPSPDGSFENLESDETYVCHYEETLSDEEVVKKEIKQIIDEEMTLSIEKELSEYQNILRFLEDDNLPNDMDGPEFKEKRHNFRRKVLFELSRSFLFTFRLEHTFVCKMDVFTIESPKGSKFY